MNFPTTSNVLQFFTEAGDKVSVRPSGTEPKIKFYVEVREDLPSKEMYEETVKKAEAKDRPCDRRPWCKIILHVNKTRPDS